MPRYRVFFTIGFECDVVVEAKDESDAYNIVANLARPDVHPDVNRTWREQRIDFVTEAI